MDNNELPLFLWYFFNNNWTDNCELEMKGTRRFLLLFVFSDWIHIAYRTILWHI